MDNKQYFVFEQVTNMDRNIEVLARAKAECIYAKHFNMCRARDCDTCEKGRKLNIGYKELAMCDQLKMDQLASDSAAFYIHTKKENKRRDFQDKWALRIILVLLILLVSAVWSKFLFSEEYHTYYVNDEYITEVLEATHSHMRDVNNDGLLNCIDYSVVFKQEWDKRFRPEDCEIIRNDNYVKKWHHLFIRCRKHRKAKWLYVEPQAGKKSYKMFDFWGDSFSIAFNKHGETERWLTSVRLGTN